MAELIDQARAIITDCGMGSFKARDQAFATDHSLGPVLVPMFAIRVSDTDRPWSLDAPRCRKLIRNIRDGEPVPPIELNNDSLLNDRYVLVSGYHRFHLAWALGYTHIWALRAFPAS